MCIRDRGKALRQFLSERPDVERVFLCLDADKAGEDACKRLTALLPDTVSVTRIQPCMKDWNDVLVHRAEIPNRNYFKSIVLKEPSKPETVKIIRMSDVGRAELGPQDTRSYMKMNGIPMVGVVVIPQPGANHIEIADAVYARMESMKKDLPDDVVTSYGFDNTRFILSLIHISEPTRPY